MRLRTLALATVGSLALVTAATAGGHGGLGGGIGGGLGGGIGGGIGAGGLGGHGGIGGGIGGGVGMPTAVGGGPIGAAGFDQGPVRSQADTHASSTGKAHANDRSVLGDATAGVASDEDVDAAEATNHGRDRRDAARAHRSGPTEAATPGVTHSNLNAGLRGATTTTTTSANTVTRDATDTSNSARLNRMGPSRASASGVAHSNERAGLRTGATSANALSGLQTGMTVKAAGGATLGEVTRVERSADGTVRSVLVRSADGAHRVIHLAPSSLSVSGGVVVTEQTKLGGHG